ncbi:hypothetical protein [Burkholderia sp. IMCC1007]|uniref:hypothetical protein n=1 Tax=Burkholderia sp. IMCC1007 TaxID=3004104 RepID=UPI0022B42C0B|nr:hypothetical protein [Burkholderia sp. IMCC1007]
MGASLTEPRAAENACGAVKRRRSTGAMPAISGIARARRTGTLGPSGDPPPGSFPHGRNHEALVWFDRAIAIFAKDEYGDSDVRDTWATGPDAQG